MKTIILTNNEELKIKLQNKLVEYKTRFNNDLDTFTKLTLLENLLENNKIDIEEQFILIFNTLPLEHAYKTPEQIRPIFENAWGVIDDYNATGGLNVTGGILENVN